MKGAIIGDVVGSRFEFFNIKSKQFALFNEMCSFTDDTVMTIAVANALSACEEDLEDFRGRVGKEMRLWGHIYPGAGYGNRFRHWLAEEDPEPYYSCGNGSAMRVSACGFYAKTLTEALAYAQASAEVTHNHPEGIKGAKATAAAIFLARQGKKKEEIKSYIQKHFYTLEKTLDDIRPEYVFNETCQKTVPEAIQAFLESESFEDAIRNAISIGGDSDTIGAITGGIAWAYYGRNGISEEMQKIWETTESFLPKAFVEIIERFEEKARI